jgi:DNA-binding CsgD family transcriptional regulator
MRDRWSLTGRDDELRLIADALGSDGCQGIAVAGRAGVGKSRLTREAAAAAGSDWSLRYIVATASGSTVPMGAFAHWIDEFSGAPSELVRRVTDALTRDAVPGRLLLVVDDAHLLDELSAHVVHQLVVQHAATALLTIRTGRQAPDAVRALWKDGWLLRHELQPLTRGDTLELLGSALGATPDGDCAERMWRLTRGNALYLRQLVDQEHAAGRLVTQDGRCRWLGTPELSPSLVELVEEQIGAVPERVRDVVDLVVVGEPVDWECLAVTADPLALEQAEQRGLIRSSGDAVYVGHPIYAEIRLEQCGPLRLRRLRGVLACAMKASTGPTDAVRRGLLWLDSDLPPDPEVLGAAAEAATSLLDFTLAERFSKAIDASGSGGAPRVRRAYNLLMLQNGDEVDQIIDTIATGDVPESSFINDVILRAANLLWTRRAPEESWRVIDDALQTATGPRVAQLLAFRANQLALAGRPRDVVEVMKRVDYRALDGFGTTIALCAETLALGELGLPTAAGVKAAACYQVVGTTAESRFLEQPLVEFHSFALVVCGSIRAAVDIARSHCDRSIGQPANAQAMAEAILGVTALGAGDLAAALRHLPASDAAVEADFMLANSFHRFQLMRVQALARSGDPETAVKALSNARKYRNPAYEYIKPYELLTEAWVAAAQSRVADARRLATESAEIACAQGQLAREVLCLQTATQFGDGTTATRLEELCAVVEGPRAAIAARYAHAVSCADAAGIADVSGEFEAMGDLLAAADAAGQAAVAYRNAGLRGSAITAVSRCASLAERAGGATSPAIVAARVDFGLTAREREIALLVGKGLSTKQIAATTSLSVRTVEGHLYRASVKLGATGRSDVARIVEEADTLR